MHQHSLTHRAATISAEFRSCARTPFQAPARRGLVGACAITVLLAAASPALAGGSGTFPHLYTIGSPGDFHPASDVAIYADGDVPRYVFVADRGSATRIVRFNGTGQTNVLSASVALTPDRRYSLIGLAVNDVRGSPGFGNVYVSQMTVSGPGLLTAFDTNLVSLFSHNLVGVSSPNDVAIDAAGNVYVADGVTKGIHMFTAADVLSSAMSISPSKFFNNSVVPSCISVDHNDRVHATSWGRYQVFNSDTKLKAIASVSGALGVCALNPCADGYVAHYASGAYDFLRYNWDWSTTTGAVDLTSGIGWLGRPEAIEYQKFTYGLYNGEVAPYWQQQKCDERLFGSKVSTIEIFGQSYLSVPVPSGMRAWWRFEETQQSGTPQVSTNYLDALGANSATPQGPIVPRTVEGMVRSGFDTKAGTAFLTAADNGALNFGSGSMTIEGWMRSEQTGGVATLLDKRVGTGVGYSLFLYQGRIGFQTNVGSSYLNYVPGAGTADQAAVGAWKHFAVVLDRTNFPSTIRVYVDAVAVGVAATPPAGSIDNAGPLYFGRTNSGSTPFVGAMDEVTLYDVPLTTAQIQGIFQAGSAGKHVYVASSSGV